MIEVDYIIVGQGLAGTVMAFHLLSAGQKIVVIDKDVAFDKNEESISSRIAAGVINPITGKRYVKSWKIDQLLPAARQTYQGIEALLNVSIWHEKSFMRTIKSIEDENQWLLKCSYDEYAQYCSDKIYPSVSEHISDDFTAFIEIKQAAQVNMAVLIQAFNQYFKKQNILFKDSFDYDAIKYEASEVVYKDFKASKIIFCEGAEGAQNPFFIWLPFNLDKGELFVVRIPNFNFNNIFKHDVSLVPLGNDLYWVGATNEWKFEDALPTEANRQKMENELKAILKIPFEIVEHKAAIRPTVKDRRPFIGCHPQYSSLAIFNGLGTKGASLAPYWSKHFVDALLNGIELDKEVDIKRFNNSTGNIG